MFHASIIITGVFEKNRNEIKTTILYFSLGVLFGVVTDNIGLGMMIGVAVGLCGGSAAGTLKGKKLKEASDEEKKNDEK